MFKQVDWQMVLFVSASLYQEYLVQIRFPRVYYWDGERSGRNKATPPPGDKAA